MTSFENICKDASILEDILKLDSCERKKRLRLRNFKKEIDNFVFGDKIGQGSFGLVYRAYQISTRKTFAIKKKELSASTFEFDSKSTHYYEYLILRKNICHQHIVRFIDLLIDAKYYYYIYEICENGNLSSYKSFELSNNRNLGVENIWKWANQLVSAVYHIQLINIIHMDIKLSNLLLDENLDLKLADFDAAIDVSDLGHDRIVRNQSLCLSSSPMNASYSPELVRGENFSFKVDTWAIGAVLYELSSGQSINNIVKILNSTTTNTGLDVLIRPFHHDEWNILNLVYNLAELKQVHILSRIINKTLVEERMRMSSSDLKIMISSDEGV